METDIVPGKKNKNRYLFIAKGLDTEEVELVRSFPILRSGRYAGGYLELRYGTRKTVQPTGFRTIGEDRENAQKVGLEGYFDKFLKGTNG